jgi:hypothetical protein
LAPAELAVVLGEATIAAATVELDRLVAPLRASAMIAAAAASEMTGEAAPEAEAEADRVASTGASDGRSALSVGAPDAVDASVF